MNIFPDLFVGNGWGVEKKINNSIDGQIVVTILKDFLRHATKILYQHRMEQWNVVFFTSSSSYCSFLIFQ